MLARSGDDGGLLYPAVYACAFVSRLGANVRHTISALHPHVGNAQLPPNCRPTEMGSTLVLAPSVKML